MTQPATEPEPKPGDTLETRVGKLEDGQESMSSKLDTILDKLTGQPAEPVTTADPAPAAIDVGEQVRQAVRDVHAERDQAAAAKPDKPKPEMPPREAGQPVKQRLARIIHGREPGR